MKQRIWLGTAILLIIWSAGWADPTNYKITVLPNANQGNVICQFIANAGSEKGYTAPFLQEGVHYQIITPPVVYAGQSFWITVVVLESTGQTKDEYDGITTFSATERFFSSRL